VAKVRGPRGDKPHAFGQPAGAIIPVLHLQANRASALRSGEDPQLLEQRGPDAAPARSRSKRGSRTARVAAGSRPRAWPEQAGCRRCAGPPNPARDGTGPRSRWPLFRQGYPAGREGASPRSLRSGLHGGSCSPRRPRTAHVTRGVELRVLTPPNAPPLMNEAKGGAIRRGREASGQATGRPPSRTAASDRQNQEKPSDTPGRRLTEMRLTEMRRPISARAPSVLAATPADRWPRWGESHPSRRTRRAARTPSSPPGRASCHC